MVSPVYIILYVINWVHKLVGFEDVNPCDKFVVKSMAEASSPTPRRSVKKSESTTRENHWLDF